MIEIKWQGVPKRAGEGISILEIGCVYVDGLRIQAMVGLSENIVASYIPKVLLEPQDVRLAFCASSSQLLVTRSREGASMNKPLAGRLAVAVDDNNDDKRIRR